MLGGEIFAQGQAEDGDHGFAALNFGGSYELTEYFSCLFSLGHSVDGDRHTLWFLGFTAPGEPKIGFAPTLLSTRLE